MGLFSRKPDPISQHAKALNERIAALEEQIKTLNSKIESSEKREAREAAPAEPVFEKLDQEHLKGPADHQTTREHYNELGLRKFDLAALFSRWVNFFRGPATTNPKLVNYLAAGSVQGLRPLRYERRVARNRFMLLAAFFVLLLWGLLAVFLNHR